MPLCSYFQQGQCSAANCPYRHSYFRKDIPHCENFLRGFCEKGQLCSKKHVLVCTNADCSGDLKICPLFHKKKKKKTKAHSAADEAAGVKKQRRKLVVREKTSFERDEAWPEFVTLSGSDDEVSDVQLEMPSRTSNNIKRFLARRTRPVWPDYSKGLSAEPVELGRLFRINGQLRQTIRKARWLRQVRSIKIQGDFIPLDFTPETTIAKQPTAASRSSRSKRPRKRRSRKSSIAFSAASEESSDDSVRALRKRKERVFETDDDEDFDPAYRTYGEALKKAGRIQSSVGSADSVSSYTSPADSSDESLDGKDSDDPLKVIRSHCTVESDGSKRTTLPDDDEWLLDYLYRCEGSVSPLPEPERLDCFGPVYEHWEFRTGDRIRETIEKFKRKRSLPDSSAAGMDKLSERNRIKRATKAIDFIPLREHEEGEILSESEEEEAVSASGDDFAVVDMELASDDELFTTTNNEEKRQLDSEAEGEIFDDVSEPLEFVDDVSDLEEGEVL